MDRFACPCCGADLCSDELKSCVADLENGFGPVTITSGYRCPAHNAAVGGVAGSQHLLGKAVDIFTLPKNQENLIAWAKKVGFTGFGRGSTFTHCDLGPAREWTYPS